MVNKLYVGFSRNVELPKGGCLFIHDDVPDVPRARVFDPLKDAFNLLKNIEYKKARQIADVLYAIYPQGENTLTVRNGKRALLELLLNGADRFDRLRIPRKAEPGAVEAMDAIKDILISPVLHRVLCSVGSQFSFRPNSVILARVNRAELGEFDALVLGLFLMAHYKGQIVVPDFGFYGHDAHISLIRENRLVAGVNTLQELSPKLRQNVLLMKEKIGMGATVADAETLAGYAGLGPGTNGFNDFVTDAIV